MKANFSSRTAARRRRSEERKALRRPVGSQWRRAELLEQLDDGEDEYREAEQDGGAE